MILSDCPRRKSKIILKICKCKPQVWTYFKRHHYLSGNLLNNSDCYLATWNDKLVAFASVRCLPGKFKNNKKAYIEQLILEWEFIEIIIVNYGSLQS